MSELSLNLVRHINAPVESVFNAWLDPELLAQFMKPADSVTTSKISLDAKTGGRFNIVMIADGKELPHSGEYLVIAPHSQIVFTWESPFSIEGSTVTLDFSETKNGTTLQLNHVKFPNEESRNNHEGGWTAIMAKLDSVVF